MNKTYQILLTIFIHLLGWLTYFSLTVFPTIYYRQRNSNFSWRRISRNLNLSFLGEEINIAHLNIFIQSLLLILIFYVNFYILIPRFLIRNKFKPYAFWIVILLLMAVVVHYYFRWYVVKQLVPELPTGFYLTVLSGFIFSTLAMLAISTLIQMSFDWYKNQKVKDETINQQLKAELSFLKSQISPHFIFNMLNNIRSMVRMQHPETEKAIIKLSDLLRYSLYVGEQEHVSLQKEVEYIRDYVNLQKLRLTENTKITLEMERPEKDYKIPPMLLIPLIENAFKYGVSSAEPTEIEIHLNVTEEEMCFSTQNDIPSAKKQLNGMETSGVGLVNLKRRLEILFPKKHEFLIREDEQKFETHLKIPVYA